MISVVMITMNEEGAIKKVVGDIKKAVPEAEILIVDSSSDRTPEIAGSLGVKVIRQFPPQGYGNAMNKALRSALGEVVVTLDCDDTYPAYEIPRLADLALNEGFDVVDGSRLKHKPKAMPWMNFAGNKIFALIASVLFFKKLSDLHSGMRAYKKELINNLQINPNGAALPVELLLRPMKLGYKIKVVYIDYFQRVGESTMRPLETAWWTLKSIIRSRFL